ncbi:putative oxidoreductase with FAD/NAD(P)-binding domain [Candidatus Terasakiella magnetica]|uniref:Putative oxidoreductase with FAD/NAD(P)-binding domain n=1 Tax=Candidatus Terasakiella magnetica TaxID=1867952 RepID=A0A1C3RLK6_9PROT|nr:NAD(P)/FAD-dependent oxidoreductase [Candidatus Terasakiella magnetica]SCA58190.1 putative oxidoreductase with FAD/NAD(P)-binding domain [Candidatus Terasakiella magnetica]
MALHNVDVLIIGAGAAGMMCAIEAAKRGRKTLVIDHAKKLAEKIRISGGGRCNFTNMDITPKNYLSENPHFCKSALNRYTNWDFIGLMSEYEIAYHERDHGQLFCDDSAQQIIDMLEKECRKAGAKIRLNTKVEGVSKNDGGFLVMSDEDEIECEHLVVASGGLSIPKIGASNFGLKLAEKMGLNVIHPRPALVPFTFDQETRDKLSGFQGIALDSVITYKKAEFREALLFTHKGLSGPSILQISSYWTPGETVQVNLAPDTDVMAVLKKAKNDQPKQEAQTVISQILPKRLAVRLVEQAQCHGKMAELSDKKLQTLAESINNWQLLPSGTEGYKTAEVMSGGVDTNELSSKTFEAKKVPGLYFIGEVVDVTGHLGGFNFQWAWSSGWCAGQFV